VLEKGTEQAVYRIEKPATKMRADPFVRVPTELLTALFMAPLSGTQLRVVLWVIRQTYGWNRPSVRFTWYRIALELNGSRPATYRAGQALLGAGILSLQGNQVAVQRDPRRWRGDLWGRAGFDGVQWRIGGARVARKQQTALPDGIGGVAGEQPECFPDATLFRPWKESSKKKTNINNGGHPPPGGRSQPGREPQGEERKYCVAGAARPIPGKYDGLSQD
jgi:phage replication O-like protein O